MSALKNFWFVKSFFILLTLVICFFQSQSAFNQSLNQPLPNLRWISLSFSPNPVYQNGDITLIGSVKNDGTASTGSEFNINFFLGETPDQPNYSLRLLTIEMSELAAGQTKNFSEIGEVPLETPPGYYYVWGGLDPLHKITESNEDDNTTNTVVQVHVLPTTTPCIVVTSPNGDDIWNVGVTYNITWNSSLTSGYVDIDYSINGGSSWIPIISTTHDDGIHAWTIPNTPSSNCLVKVADADGDPSDKSDNVFTIRAIIQPDIAVTPSSWDYGSIHISDYLDKTFVVKNEGNANLIVTATNLTGANVSEFSIQSGGGSFMLTPGAIRNLVVRFSPTSSGIKTVTLSISSNDPDENPLLINLRGTGTTEWKVPIIINGGNVTLTRTFGGDANATDGFDSGLDVAAAPPGMTYYAYFELAVFPNYLETDIRKWIAPYNTEISWTLKIVNATATISTLSWNTSDIPTTMGTFTLSGTDADINMKSLNSATVTGSVNLTIKYTLLDIATYNFPQMGWYLISLPVTPANNSLSTLFPTAMTAFGYNSATGSYYAVTSLDTKKGYWLLIPGATTATISGTRLNSFTEHYSMGWHLIGTVRGTTNFTDPKDNPNGAVLSAWSYNPGTSQYVQVYPPGTGILEEKQGYWLAVMQSCDLTIGGGIMAEASNATVGNHELFKQQFGSQPPVPPFIGNKMVAELLPTSHKIISRNYPNPFNPETMIEYSLPNEGLTQVHIYNSLGQKIRTLVEALQQAGVHQMRWDGRNDNGELVTNGVYYYKIINAEFVETKKMLLLR
jgi:hypothetical protein